jgi:hypothetical protein
MWTATITTVAALAFAAPSSGQTDETTPSAETTQSATGIYAIAPQQRHYFDLLNVEQA